MLEIQQKRDYLLLLNYLIPNKIFIMEVGHWPLIIQAINVKTMKIDLSS